MGAGNPTGERAKISVDDALEIAIELHKRGNIEEAVTIYGDVLEADPDNPNAFHYLGIARHQLGESDAAIELLQRSLELAPGNVNAINNLGNMYRETGMLERAEECYREVLELAPRHADTLVNMAVSLRGLKKTDEALAAVKEAIEINPKHAQAWHNLGNIYCDLKQFKEALSAYGQSDELEPDSERPSLEIARILAKSGRRNDAIEVLRRVLKRDPINPVVRHTLASISGEDVPARASDAFVRYTFDNFASSFDESLARLEYTAPRLVADEILQFAAARKVDILDIGCGTGLCGPLLRSVASVLIGVDLSPAMLAKAKQRGVYDRLEEAELTAFMRETDAHYDAVICVDTLIYFGRIDEVIAAAGNRLRAGGCLVFTVESHGRDVSEAAYRLQDHGRYSHSDDYVSQTESGEPVPGALVVARKQS